jgi:hypothetical protein
VVALVQVTMSEQGPVPMDYPRFTTGLRLVVAQFSGLEDPPRRRPALLPEAAPVPIELATGGVPEEEDAPDEPEVETKGTSPQCEHVPVPAVAWQQPESKSTPEPPEEDQAAQEAQEPEVHSMIEEESESDDEEAHRVTLLYGKRSQADEQRMVRYASKRSVSLRTSVWLPFAVQALKLTALGYGCRRAWQGWISTSYAHCTGPTISSKSRRSDRT